MHVRELRADGLVDLGLAILLLVLLSVKLLESHLASLDFQLCVVDQEVLLLAIEELLVDFSFKLPSGECFEDETQ